MADNTSITNLHLCQHEGDQLSTILFQVFQPTYVFNPSNGIEPRLIPDHSIIACEYTLQCLESHTQDNVDNSTLEKRFKKFDLSNIPLNFCDENETRQVLDSLIDYENENDDQSHINRIYDDFCSVAKKKCCQNFPTKTL